MSRRIPVLALMAAISCLPVPGRAATRTVADRLSGGLAPWLAAARRDADPAVVGRLFLERGARSLTRGRKRTARRQWHKALEAGGEIAIEARNRLRSMSDAHEFTRWRRATSPHFVLHAPRRSVPGQAPEAFLAERERVYRQIVDTLGTEPDGPIAIYVYRSDRQALRLLGRSLGFADPARREIHIRQDQAPGHEETHVIAWCWNHRGSGVDFLEEGLAVSMSAHPGSPHATAAEALARSQLPSLHDLVTRFRAYRSGYALAGSFVTELLERHGVEMIHQMYVGGDDGDFLGRLEKGTGEALETLQSRWETLLAAQGAANREDLLQALALMRMGRLDEAIELLESQRREQPDSTVLDFALAQARRDHGDLEASAAAYRRVLEKPLPHRLAWMQESARRALSELDTGTPVDR